MSEVYPCAVSDFSPFSAGLVQSNANSLINSLGRVSHDGTWLWVANSSMLKVFSTKTKELCASWNFNVSSKSDCPYAVTAVEELRNSNLTFPCLVVTLESASDGGLLCLFNVKASKVVNAIHIPYKITSLEIISSIGSATVLTRYINDQLRFLFGIAAVGTEGGHVLLVDLCLDAVNISDETFPDQSDVIRKNSHNIPRRREVALSKRQHLCFLLNDDSFNIDMFEYHGDRSLDAFPSDDVIVSTLKYIRNLALLAVGFNFGGIEFWNLKDLNLIYSMPLHASQQPLVHFAFQEPENDPRNFCYLWTIRGHYQGENFRPEKTTVATLYSMCFAKKEWTPHFGFFYKGFQNCTLRFEMPLCSDPYVPYRQPGMLNSRLVACSVISPTEMLSREVYDPFQNDEASSEGLHLCAIAWESWPAAGEGPISSYLAIFDLNQWYQAQMPSKIRCGPNDLCSYLGFFSMVDVFAKIGHRSLLDVFPHSISRFKSSTKTEETFFPSSLAFRIHCISSNGVLHASYLGIQRQLLSEINKAGIAVLIEPQKVYKCCYQNGLVSNSADVNASIPINQTREDLLTLALNNNMYRFLTTCAQHSRTADFVRSGGSSKVLHDWLWKTVTHIKKTTDKQCSTLFDCSGQGLDENTLVTLYSYERHLVFLSTVMGVFQNSVQHFSEQGNYEFLMRKDVLDIISSYLHTVLWLYESKILPEHAEGADLSEDQVAYPVSFLTKTYLLRRLEIQRIHSSIEASDILLIDSIVEKFGPALVNMWEKKGGTRQYPPPSVYAAVSSYLVESVPLVQKHMLMFYLLLDMSAYLADCKPHLLENLMLFCASNNMSLSLSKLTQAFWQLDHQDFETALNSLLEPTIISEDIEPWHHMKIIKSLLFQGQEKKALKYIRIRKPQPNTLEEKKLHLSILLANRLTSDAFNYIRKNQSDMYFEDILSHLFEGCHQTNSLEALFHLPLNSLEYDALYKFLSSSSDPRLQELLVMFHLVCCCPLEASKINEKLFSQERNMQNCEQAACRNALVEGFLDTLPLEQRILSQEFTQRKTNLDVREGKKMPLSARLTSNSMFFASASDFIRDIISNYCPVETISVEDKTPFRSWKSSSNSSPFVCSPLLSENRKRRYSLHPAPPTSKSGSASCDYTTPIKKFRIFDVASSKKTDSDYRKSIRPLNSEMLSLLQTPPVCRKTPNITSQSVVSNAEARPSILKSKGLSSNTLDSLDQEVQYCKTPSVFSEASEGSPVMEMGYLNFAEEFEELVPQPKLLRFKTSPPEVKAATVSEPHFKDSKEKLETVPLLPHDDAPIPSEKTPSEDLVIQSPADVRERLDDTTFFSLSESDDSNVFISPQRKPQIRTENVPISSGESSAASQKLPDLPNPEGIIPKALQIDTSPYLSTRARSRSKSMSPASLIKPKSSPREFKESSPLPQHKEAETQISKEDNTRTIRTNSPSGIPRLLSPILPQTSPKTPTRTAGKIHKKRNIPAARQSATKPRKVKGKRIGKSSQASEKMEFQFADPSSPADSSIIQALATTPTLSTIPFIFSPPTTRQRARRKQFEESLNASSVSTAKNTVSVVDPLLGDDEKPELNFSLASDFSLSQQRHRTEKSSKKSIVPDTTNLLTPTVAKSEESLLRSSAQKHRMVLRKSKK